MSDIKSQIPNAFSKKKAHDEEPYGFTIIDTVDTVKQAWEREVEQLKREQQRVIEQLRQEHDEVMSDLKDELRRVKDARDREIANLETRLENLNIDYQDVQDKLANAEKELENTDQKLFATQGELGETLLNLRAERKSFDQELETLKYRLEVTQQQLRQVREEKNELGMISDELIEERYQQIQQVEAGLLKHESASSLVGEVKKLQELLKFQDTNIDALLAEKTQLGALLDERTRQRDEMIAIYQEEVQDQEETIQTLAAQKKSLEKELNQLRNESTRKVMELQEQLKYMNTELEELDDHLEFVNTERHELREKVDYQEQLIKVIRAERAELMKRSDRMVNFSDRISRYGVNSNEKLTTVMRPCEGCEFFERKITCQQKADPHLVKLQKQNRQLFARVQKGLKKIRKLQEQISWN